MPVFDELRFQIPFKDNVDCCIVVGQLLLNSENLSEASVVRLLIMDVYIDFVTCSIFFIS